MEKSVLEECRSLYEQYSYILKNVYNVGYKETILKLFSLVDVRPDINIYQINQILVEADFNSNSIRKSISYDNLTDDFTSLSNEIIYNYYISKTPNSSISMDSFINSLKEEVYS